MGQQEGKPVMGMSKKRRVLSLSAVCLGGLFMIGCGSYDPPFVKAYKQGDFAKARTDFDTDGQHALAADKDDPAKHHIDKLVFLLEKGAILRANGDLKGSGEAFDDADLLFKKFDAKAKARVGKEVKAALSNLAEIDYEGYGYDHIMMHTYAAMNYIEIGDFTAARIELNRLADAQETIKENKARQIDKLAKAQEEKPKGSSGLNANKSYDAMKNTNSPAGAKLAQAYGPWADQSGEAVYTNAFAEYLQGVYYLHNGTAGERDGKGLPALRNAAAMSSNPYITQDLDLAAEMATGKATRPVTYIFFESGVAPRRDQLRIDIPIFIYNVAATDTGVDYVGMAFPMLVPEAGGLGTLRVVAGTQTCDTHMLVDMDAVIGREFKDELPAVITRTLIASGTKAAIAYAANKATEKNAYANIGTRIFTTIAQALLAQADLRTWRTLPKTIAVARLDTPADGMLSLVSLAGVPLASVKVNPDSCNIVWVRGPANGVVCHTFALDPKAMPAAPSTQPVIAAN